MARPDRGAVLALGGAVQALTQVRRIAAHGQGDSRDIEPPVRALLGQYDGDMAALYGGAEAVRSGLRLLTEHLQQPRDAGLTRYLVAILALERRVTRQRRSFGEMVPGIQDAARQADYFGSPLHPNVIRNIGDVYSRTVSTVRPRIIVKGERIHLEDEHNAALIRTLLLAALRSLGLWRQNGGRRFQLILFRARVIETARDLASV